MSDHREAFTLVNPDQDAPRVREIIVSRLDDDGNLIETRYPWDTDDE